MAKKEAYDGEITFLDIDQTKDCPVHEYRFVDGNRQQRKNYPDVSSDLPLVY